MKNIFVLTAIFLGSILSACSANRHATNAVPEQSSAVVKEYQIGVGDNLSVNVWRNPELSLTVPVRPDGMISLPLVGDIRAAGVTANSLSESLQKELVNFIRNPQVTVIVASAGSADFQHRVRITGAVAEPLSIPHRGGMTVLDLVLEAGGLNEFALPNKAVLYRKTDTEIAQYRVRLGDILKKGDLSTNYELSPSDILIVPERIL